MSQLVSDDRFEYSREVWTRSARERGAEYDFLLLWHSGEGSMEVSSKNVDDPRDVLARADVVARFHSLLSHAPATVCASEADTKTRVRAIGSVLTFEYPQYSIACSTAVPGAAPETLPPVPSSTQAYEAFDYDARLLTCEDKYSMSTKFSVFFDRMDRNWPQKAMHNLATKFYETLPDLVDKMRSSFGNLAPREDWRMQDLFDATLVAQSAAVLIKTITDLGEQPARTVKVLYVDAIDRQVGALGSDSGGWEAASNEYFREKTDPAARHKAIAEKETQ